MIFEIKSIPIILYPQSNGLEIKGQFNRNFTGIGVLKRVNSSSIANLPKTIPLFDRP
jgi:hypothetical protein